MRLLRTLVTPCTFLVQRLPVGRAFEVDQAGGAMPSAAHIDRKVHPDMFRYTAGAIVVALMVGASAVTSAHIEPTNVESGVVVGADAHDVMPVAGGGIELYACRDVSEDGPYDIVEFGPDATGDAGGVQLVVDAAPAGGCAHLVVFTQPVATLAI